MRISIRVILFISLCCSACSLKSIIESNLTEYFETNSLLSIAALKDMYVDGSQRLTQVAYIRGIITANDLMGEFPNTMIIEDDSGAIEVSVDLGSSLTYFKLGCVVTLNCVDLWLGSSGGVLALGNEPTGDYSVDALSSSEFVQRSTIESYFNEPVARVLSIDDFNKDLISTYLRIDNLRFVDCEVGDHYCDRDPDSGRTIATTHTLEDESGSRVELYVPSTVAYADEQIPIGLEGSVYVILGYFGSQYSVRLVYGEATFESGQ